MFNDKKKDHDKAQREADKAKSVEEKAVEAKQARDQDSSSAQKNQIEKSFGDDQNHRYDPEALKAGAAKKKADAAGVPPAQEASTNDAADVHVNIEKEKQALVDKDYSDEIKVGDLVYIKPQESTSNAPVSSIDGRAWTVMALAGDKANCLIQDPANGRQRTEVLKLSDLMLDEPM